MSIAEVYPKADEDYDNFHLSVNENYDNFHLNVDENFLKADHNFCCGCCKHLHRHWGDR